MLFFLCTGQTIKIVKKSKGTHPGFDINHSIPSKIFLSDGKGDKLPFVSKTLSPGQTGIMNRYNQCHKDFDLWQTSNALYAVLEAIHP